MLSSTLSSCRELRHQSKAAYQVFRLTSPLFTGGGPPAGNPLKLLINLNACNTSPWLWIRAGGRLLGRSRQPRPTLPCAAPTTRAGFDGERQHAPLLSPAPPSARGTEALSPAAAAPPPPKKNKNKNTLAHPPVVCMPSACGTETRPPPPAVAFVGVRSVVAPPVVGWFVYSVWFRWAHHQGVPSRGIKHRYTE
jgi:hypothetical protein